MSRGARITRSEFAGLGALALFTLAAVGGFGIFALHPERIPQDAFSIRFFAWSFPIFARAHIVIAALALGWILSRRLGVRWIPAALAIAAVSFLAEHLGTGFGLPFGAYEYTPLLGTRIGDRVPALIPVSWFLMALPSWLIAHAVLRERSTVGARVLLGAAWLTAWDLALDPAMSFLTPYWVWADTGPYYGMPWLNLPGWMATGVLLMGILELSEARVGWTRLPLRWMAAYWGTMTLLPLGMLLAAAEWLGVFVTLGTVAALAAVPLLAGAPGRALPAVLPGTAEVAR